MGFAPHQAHLQRVLTLTKLLVCSTHTHMRYKKKKGVEKWPLFSAHNPLTEMHLDSCPCGPYDDSSPAGRNRHNQTLAHSSHAQERARGSRGQGIMRGGVARRHLARERRGHGGGSAVAPAVAPAVAAATLPLSPPPLPPTHCMLPSQPPSPLPRHRRPGAYGTCTDSHVTMYL